MKLRQLGDGDLQVSEICLGTWTTFGGSLPDSDDLFLVVKGTLHVDLRDRTIEVGPGELLVVPRGVEHRPRADEEVHLVLIERRGTPNTGDADAEAFPEVEI